MQTERQLQQSIMDWAHGYAGNLDGRLRFLFPVENAKGATRGPAGYEYVSGVPDLFLAVPMEWVDGVQWAGLWLELKRKGKKPKAHQLEMHSRLRGQWYAVDWADNYDDAAGIIEQYLAGERCPEMNGELMFAAKMEAPPEGV